MKTADESTVHPVIDPTLRIARTLAAALIAALALAACETVQTTQSGAVGVESKPALKQLPVTNPAWVKPFPPFRIVGNLYYVGTYDLAVYLIVTSGGNVLVNTGINDSTPVIKANIEALGFRFEDIRLLLATHGHWDHVGAMAEIKRRTGARMLMHEGDADLLESGGSLDYRFPDGRGTIYEPVKVDQRLKDGDKVRLGNTELTVIHHPGHTKGATSFTFTTQDGGRTYRVLIVNMPTINPGVTVEASSPVLIEKSRTVVSDGAGQYRITDLLPGRYTVTFTLTGFSVVRREGIEVSAHHDQVPGVGRIDRQRLHGRRSSVRVNAVFRRHRRTSA